MENTSFMILALGFFDCVHLGHRAIIARTMELARAQNMTAAAFTFTNDKRGGKQIYTFDERSRLFTECGVGRIVARPFDEKLRLTAGADFLDMLTEEGARGFVCGEDYTFGAGGTAGAAELKAYCAERGLVCEVMGTLTAGGEKISSTRIKQLISSGDVAGASALLGRPYFLGGEVVRGRGEGRLYGIPTANLAVPSGKLLPRAGVYAAKAYDGEREYRAVMNIGAKPTFGIDEPTVEVMLDGFDGDLYGKRLTVEPSEYLRPVTRFSSPRELAAQIKKDMQRSRQC